MQNVFAGVDVGGARIKVGLVAEHRDPGGADSVSITAACIWCPGRIDFTSGRVVWLRSKLEFLEGIPLAVRLGDRLACPVVCDNDVNTIPAGEMRFGAGRIAQLSESIADTTGAASVGEQIKIPNYESVRASRERNAECFCFKSPLMATDLKHLVRGT